MEKVSVIGFGRVGGALALALGRRGVAIPSVSGTSRKGAEGVLSLIDPRPKFFEPGEFSPNGPGIVILSVRDDQIEAAARELASGESLDGLTFLHTSGSKGSEVLAPLRDKGAETGSVHPLVSVSDPVSGSESFEGVFFCVEGTDRALDSARQLVDALGGVPFEVASGMKPLYHAAAVMACGHLVALFDEAVEALSHCGPDREEASRVLLPLVSSTVANLARQTPAEALTGTFARGDMDTFRAHVERLRNEVAPAILDTYLLLGERSLELAEKAGLSAERSAELLKAVRAERGADA